MTHTRVSPSVQRVGLSSRQISDIEKAYPHGLSSKEIIQVLDDHGEPLSEATLRKYVQLGLLPRSRRVGQKGKNRGSKGIYPVEVIRRLDEIRRAMSQGDTLDELARAAQAVRAKLSSVRVALDETMEAAETDLAGRDLDRKGRAALKSELTSLKRGAKDWMKSMERWVVDVDGAERAGSDRGPSAVAGNGQMTRTRGAAGRRARAGGA